MKQIKSRLLATLFSIFLPGAGQVFKHQNFKTIFGYSIFFLFLILFILFKLQLHFWGITSLIIFVFCLYLLNIFDALVSSFQTLQLKKLCSDMKVYYTNLKSNQYTFSKKLFLSNDVDVRMMTNYNSMKKVDAIFALDYYEHFEKPLGLPIDAAWQVH